MDHNKLSKILKEMGIPDHLTCLLKNLYAGQEVTELDNEQGTSSKLRKEYIKAVYCHPVYLINIQNIMQNSRLDEAQLQLRLPGEISTTSDMQMIPLMADSNEELKNLMMRVKGESEEASLKLNIQKIKITESSTITSRQIDRETMETVTDYFLGLQNHCGW